MFEHLIENPIPLATFLILAIAGLIAGRLVKLIKVPEISGQIIAGIMEWKKNNTFGTTAFTSYGLFWLTLVALIALPTLGIGSKPTPDAMGAYLDGFFKAQEEYIKLNPEVIPYSDHFPFTACGIPSAWVTRVNCTSGRFFHHRPDDTLARVSPNKLAQLGSISHAILKEMATADALAFPARIPDAQQKEVNRQWQELFGAWQGFS